MFRLLIIGGPADDWAERLGKVVGDQVDIESARLPSAGIRQFESTPADLVVIADNRGGSRIEILARALRQRPLGQLVPLLFIGPLPEEESVEDKINDLDLVGWLPVKTSATDVVAEVEEALGAEIREDETAQEPVSPENTAATPDAGEHGSASYFDGDVVLEPVDEAATPQRVDRNSIFRSPSGQSSKAEQSVDADGIERKLKAVRHEDYYVILEVRRGAESQTVREAFHRLYARFDPESLDFRLVRQFQDEIDEIRDALEDAFAVLGDPDLRQSYLQHTVKR